jgi:hypothetical protein
MASDDEDDQRDFSQGQPLLEDVLAEFPDTTEVCPQRNLGSHLLSHRRSIWLEGGWRPVPIWASRALKNI